MTKSIEDSFHDWEGDTFGYGYGTGEEHTVGALQRFMAAIPERGYDYRVLEEALTPTVAWLLINTLCKANILSYGISPRHGWLEPEGVRLKEYLDTHTLEYILNNLWRDQDYAECYHNVCNCGPNGYVKGKHCDNPFWPAPR